MPYANSEGRFFKIFTAYYTGYKIDEQNHKRIYTYLKNEFNKNKDSIIYFLNIMQKFLDFSKKIKTLEKIEWDSQKNSNGLYVISSLYKSNKLILIPAFFAMENCENKIEDIMSEHSKKFYKIIAGLSFKNSLLYLRENSKKINSKIQLIKKRKKLSDIYEHIQNLSLVEEEDLEKFKEYILQNKNYYSQKEKEHQYFRGHYKIILCHFNNLLNKGLYKNEKMNNIPISDFMSFTLDHVIPKNWSSNTKWNNFVSKVKKKEKDITQYIQWTKNILILKNDSSHNKYLDVVYQNYKKEATAIGFSFGVCAKKYEHIWKEEDVINTSEEDSYYTVYKFLSSFLETEIIDRAIQIYLKDPKKLW